MVNGKDFFGVVMRNKAFFLCFFVLLLLVVFFIRGKLFISLVLVREKLCFFVDLFKFIYLINLSVCYVLGIELYLGVFFIVGI